VSSRSAHLILPPEVRDDMTAELIATLTGYGDEIELAMVTDPRDGGPPLSGTGTYRWARPISSPRS
jgi:hypothetical protein